MTRQIRRNKLRNELKKQNRGNKYMRSAWMQEQIRHHGEDGYLEVQTNTLNENQLLLKDYLLKKIKEGKEKLQKEFEKEQKRNIKTGIRGALNRLKDKVGMK